MATTVIAIAVIVAAIIAFLKLQRAVKEDGGSKAKGFKLRGCTVMLPIAIVSYLVWATLFWMFSEPEMKGAERYCASTGINCDSDGNPVGTSGTDR